MLTKHKACLVACGFTQVSGIDYHDTHLYAPVVCLESFHVLISIAALFNLSLRQFDISAAYLHGDIDGEVYMEPPPGYEKQGTVWLLLKGLYGLKQAGRIWHEWLKANMTKLGFTQCHRDHAVFHIGSWGGDDWAACAFWVNDQTGVGSQYQLDCVAAMFCQKYGISGEGDLCWMLGIGVTCDFTTHTISLLQELYIDNLVKQFRLKHTTTVTTPLAPGAILTKDQCPMSSEELQAMAGNQFHKLIGSLQYAALATCPDISFAVSKLAQFLTNPRHVHMDTALCILCYLKGTKTWCLNLGGEVADLAGFTDLDWGGDRDDHKSISAYVFK